MAVSPRRRAASMIVAKFVCTQAPDVVGNGAYWTTAGLQAIACYRSHAKGPAGGCAVSRRPVRRGTTNLSGVPPTPHVGLLPQEVVPGLPVESCVEVVQRVWPKCQPRPSSCRGDAQSSRVRRRGLIAGRRRGSSGEIIGAAAFVVETGCATCIGTMGDHRALRETFATTASRNHQPGYRAGTACAIRWSGAAYGRGAVLPGGRSSGSSATARRSASSKPIGCTSNSSAPEGSVTTVGTARPFDQRSGDSRVDGRDQADPQRRQPRRDQRHRHPWAAAESEYRRHAIEHLAVAQHVGSADLNFPARRGHDRRRLHEVAQRVVDRDRLRRVLQPRRSDHRGESLHEVAQRPVGLALRADHHSGAEVGQRRAVLGQGERRLVAAAEMLRLGTVTQAAEVDDPVDSLRLSHPRERRRGRALVGDEVPAARRDPSSGSGSTRPRHRVRPPADSRGAARCPRAAPRRPFQSTRAGAGTVAHHAPHLPARVDERRREPAADEAGRARHERAARHHQPSNLRARVMDRG